MYSSNINFSMILRALSFSMEALERDMPSSENALQKLKEAKKDFQLALSFSGAEKVE